MKPIETLDEISLARRLNELVKHGWGLEGFDRKKISEILTEWIDILEAEEKEAEHEESNSPR
jgi:hypothetical protein